MNANIFAQWAAHYFEAGYNVIPVCGKIPMDCAQGWQKWCETRQTQDEFDALVSASARSTGIAIITGPISGSVIDVDSDEKELLEAIPGTPMIRRGKKGCGFHYKFAEGVPRQIMTQSTLVDLLTTNSYSLVPPSIHPDTHEPYEWLPTCGLTPASELPTIKKDDIDAIIATARHLGVIRTGIRKSNSRDQPDGKEYGAEGRNEHLFRVCCARIYDDRAGVPATITDRVEYILWYDKRRHHIPWFTDPSEYHRGKDPHKMAREMFERAERGIKPKEVTPTAPVIIDTTFTIDDPPIPDNPFPKMPKGGAIEMFMDACALHSGNVVPGVALTGALGVIAALTSNKLRLDQTWSNLLLVSLAPSGVGKNTPQSIAKFLLANSGGDELVGKKLLGTNSYKSANAFYKGLDLQRERLDIVDEVTALFKEMSTSRQSNDMGGLVDTLCTFFSSSNTLYMGVAAMGESAKVKSVYNPCLSLMGYGVPSTMRKVLQARMADGGLMARFLFFHDKIVPYTTITHRYGAAGLPHEFIPKALYEFTEHWLARPIGSPNDRPNGSVTPPTLHVGPSADIRLRDLKQYEEDQVKKLSEAGIEEEVGLSAIMRRRTELINKLIICYAASQDQSEVTDDAIDFGVAVWEHCHQNMLPFVEDAMRDGKSANEFERADRIIKVVAEQLKKVGTASITRRELFRMGFQRVFNAAPHKFDQWIKFAQQREWIESIEQVSEKRVRFSFDVDEILSR